MSFRISREDLYAETEQVLDAVTDPKYIAKMQKFTSLKGDEKIQFAMANLNPEALNTEGVVLPNAFRISSRVFEGEPRYTAESYDLGASSDILGGIAKSRPELINIGTFRSPNLANALEKLRDMTGPDFGKHPETIPDWVPEIPAVIGGPGSLDIPRQFPEELGPTLDAWGCACGGAATACGGAGGGS